MPETRGSATFSARRYFRDLVRVVRNPRLLLAFAAGFLRFFLDYAFFTYLPLFLVRSHGLSTAGAGLLRSFHALGAMVTSSQAGRLAGTWDKGNLVLCAFLASGVALLSMAFAPGTGTMIPVLLLYGVANGVISPMQKEPADAERAPGSAGRHHLPGPVEPADRQDRRGDRHQPAAGGGGELHAVLGHGPAVIRERGPDGAAGVEREGPERECPGMMTRADSGIQLPGGHP